MCLPDKLGARLKQRSSALIPIRDINPTERFAIATFLLIVLNLVVFLYQMTLGRMAEERFIASFALIPNHLFSHMALTKSELPVSSTLITSMFLHGGFFHIAGNMLYLWIFGNNVEDAMGRIKFVVFYLLCGCIAAYAHAFMNSASLVPMIGASGAISGVLGAYLLLYPRARVVTLVIFVFYVRTVPVPAIVVLVFWFLLQILNAMIASDSVGGVAWYAHIAGFMAGMLLIGMFKRRDVSFGGGRRFRYP
jgi:membrane associated rhomboid family serine protease